ncbi:hypothetical protein ACFQVC_42405, partial [Streptomyces monticola]
RLVYQARLRSRYGRNWRRKAPVESLMPLRLARYGVPLADTAPAGLAAAGIEPNLLPPASPEPLQQRPELTAYPASQAQTETEPPGTPAEGPALLQDNAPQKDGQPPQPAPADIQQADIQQAGFQNLGTPVLPMKQEDKVKAFLRTITHPRDLPAQQPNGNTPDGTTHAYEINESAHEIAAEESTQPGGGADESTELTTIDRYYQGWWDYQQQHFEQPNGNQLSRYLADRDVLGRNGTPISPSTLRRYLLEFRIFAVWDAHLNTTGDEPTPPQLVQLLAQHNVTGQYGSAITTEAVNDRLLADFRRRREALRTSHQHIAN